TANQDPLLSSVPNAHRCVELWEHAFYAQRLNFKADYLIAIWNVFTFQEADACYLSLEASGASK
ncbi:hypothetical protein FA13DRAFT_1605563, partial [Coprinellus micaceus]